MPLVTVTAKRKTTLRVLGNVRGWGSSSAWITWGVLEQQPNFDPPLAAQSPPLALYLTMEPLSPGLLKSNRPKDCLCPALAVWLIYDCG